MTTTQTVYAYDVHQNTGDHQQVFDGLGKIKQSRGYAVSAKPIGKKSASINRASTVAAYFKFNLPTNAEVQKVIVEYRHAVVKASGSNKAPTFPAPEIELASKVNQNPKTFVGAFYDKAQAPTTKTGVNRKHTFDLRKYDVPINFFNNGNLRVALEYKKNVTNYTGYIRLAYIRVRIEYVTPDFDVTMSKVSGGYNREELFLKATISNKNLTKGNPVVNISLPLGLSYVRASGNGTVTQPQNRTLVWTPNVNRAGSVSVEIVVVPNVSYSSSDKMWSDSVTYTMPSYNRSKSLSITVTERPPKEDESRTKEDEPKEYEDDGKKLPDIVTIVKDEVINYTFALDNDTFERFKWEMYSKTSPSIKSQYSYEEFWETYSRSTTFIWMAENKYLELSEDGNTWWAGLTISYNTFVNNGNSKTYKIKGIGLNKASITIQGHCSNVGMNPVVFTEWKFNIIPAESDLTVPNLTKIQPTEEETHRLGDGYTYTLQSDMTLNTSEDYVRDWYKNFRIGVFNNPITANQHSYILLQTEEDSQVRDLTIPSRFDLTDATMTLTVDNPLTALIDETEYNITGTTSIPLWEDYSQSITFQKVSDNVTLTLELYDANDVLLWSQEYHLVFDAEETLLPTPVTEDSTDYTQLTDEEIFSNALWWSETQAGLNISNNVECQFTYDENYPLYIIYTGDYPEGDPDNNTVTFNEPCIIEDYKQRLTNGLFIEPIDDSVKDDGSLSTITMKAFDISNTIVLYDLPLSDNYGTNSDMAIRGIELVGEVEQIDRLILYAQLRNPTGESRQRSIIIEDTNDFSIGGNGDLWGYNTLDMVNLEDWEIELTISNNLDEVDGNLIFGNLQLNLYVERVEPSDIICYINGEDLRYYGVFITDISIPEGLQTDTSYLEVDGTDHNDPYNQSIRQKEIKIEFELGNDCDLQANTLSRRELAKLLFNDRDEYNRPIPNTIEFSHYPDIYWEYIMEDAIDDKIEIGSYTDGKVTLVVPAGTAYDKESTTTSNTGYVNGLATINPILIVKPTDEIITIREEITGQEFHIGYSGEWNDKILEIDCEDRIVWLKTDEDDIDPINLNRYVDFNSDWFRLKGEFSFSGINCIIRTVDYQERW